MRKEEIKYKIIVSTNVFISDLDKEMCAFITGQIGECKIGIDRKFRADSDVREMFESAMERRLCSDNYWRPVGPNADDSNAFEFYFKNKPTDEMIKALVEGFHEFADEKKEKNPIMQRITLLGLTVIKERSLYEETEELYDLPVITNAQL